MLLDEVQLSMRLSNISTQLQELTRKQLATDLAIASLNERTGCLTVDAMKSEAEREFAFLRVGGGLVGLPELHYFNKKHRAEIVRLRKGIHAMRADIDSYALIGVKEVLGRLDELLEGGE